MSDTSRVAVTVLSIAATPRAGRLMALATLEIVIEGVPLTLRGVRLLRATGGEVIVEMPSVRNEIGQIVPTISFPNEIEKGIELAIRREVIETVLERVIRK